MRIVISVNGGTAGDGFLIAPDNGIAFAVPLNLSTNDGSTGECNDRCETGFEPAAELHLQTADRGQFESRGRGTDVDVDHRVVPRRAYGCRKDLNNRAGWADADAAEARRTSRTPRGDREGERIGLRSFRRFRRVYARNATYELWRFHSRERRILELVRTALDERSWVTVVREPTRQNEVLSIIVRVPPPWQV